MLKPTVMSGSEQSSARSPVAVAYFTTLVSLLAAASRCSPLRHIFQSVQEQFDLQPAQGEGARWALSELPAESRVVLIGRALDAAALAQGFSACAGGNRVPPLKSE
jgi:hypothetical protein